MKNVTYRLIKETLNKLISLIVRQAFMPDRVRYERNQPLAVDPEPVEGLHQRLLKLTLLLCCIFTNTASAELHGTITGTTNYIARMYSKSNNGPALQGNLDYQHDASGIYTGISLSSINYGSSEINPATQFTNQAQLEYVPYVGWSLPFADDWRLDMQYSRYLYDNDLYALSGDYNEFYIFLNYKDLLTTQVSYSDDFYGLKDYALFFELTGRYPLTDYLEFSSTYGYSYARHVLLSDFHYWNIGLTGRYKFISLDLRYHDVYEIEFGDEFSHALLPDYPETLKASVVFAISIGF